MLEKFSHNNHRRQNPIPALAEAQILEMPECKRGRFVAPPTTEQNQRENGGRGEEGEGEEEEEEREGDREERERASMQPFMKNHSNSALLDVEPPVRLLVMTMQ